MSKLVSIIMPAYNASASIIESIESVLSQTYDNWELIVINDCSTDNTEEIISTYVKNDNRIKLLNMKQNGGVAEARNLGIINVSGEYVAFLDSDDYWTNDKLDVQTNYMMENDFEFTFSNLFVVDENGDIKGERISPSQVGFKDLLKTNHIGCLSVMLKSDIARSNLMKTIGHEDYLTWLTILNSGIVAHNCGKKLAFYRVSSNSLSSNKFRAAKWQWNIYRKELKIGFFKSTFYFTNYLVKGILKVI